MGQRLHWGSCRRAKKDARPHHTTGKLTAKPEYAMFTTGGQA